MTTTAEPKTTARHIADLLTRHYLPESRPPAGILAIEIGSPCGKRRADALWVPLTAAAGGLVGHEIKVTRGDLLTELADPAKPDPWLKYCERWWLTVAHPRLIDGLEDQIPESWGVMAPPSGRRTRTMTVVRPAPKLKPTHTAPAYERVLAWHFYRASDARNAAERRATEAQRDVESLQRQVQELRVTNGHRTDPLALRVASIIAAVEKAKADDWAWGALSDDDVVQALLDVDRSRQIAENVRADVNRIVGEITIAQRPLDHVAEQLERVRAGLPIHERTTR